MLKFSEYSKIPGIKINEHVVKVGNSFTVTMTYDVPLQVVKDYIDKVKGETQKNLLESFGAEIIAEKLIKYTLDNYMTMDNVPANAFTGGGEKTETENTPEIAETDTTAETPVEEPKAEEPKKESTPSEIELGDNVEKEEDEEESNYLNMYTTMGNPVKTGFKIIPPTQKAPKNARVGLYEGLTDADLK